MIDENRLFFDLLVIIVGEVVTLGVMLIAFSVILSRLSTIKERESLIMAELDDLKASLSDQLQAIAEGQTAENRLLVDVDEAVKKLTTPGIDPAEVEAAAQGITSATAQLRALNDATTAAAAKIEAALNPPATT